MMDVESKGKWEVMCNKFKKYVFFLFSQGFWGKIKGLLLEIGHNMGFNLGSGECTWPCLWQSGFYSSPNQQSIFLTHIGPISNSKGFFSFTETLYQKNGNE